MKMTALAAVAFGIAASVASASAAPDSGAAIPSCAVMPGWAQDGPSRLYEGDRLFEYMNGNSDGYFVYGFVRMHGVTCAQAESKVLIDISEMQDEEGAYGIFCANRDVKLPSETIGTAAQVVPRKAIFAKGRYFVEIAAQAQGDHSTLLRATASAMAGQVPGSNTVPEPIGWFPADGQTAGPPRLVPESVLGIRLLHRGYLAQYGPAKAFAVTEASDDAAKQSMEKLRTRFGSVEAAQLGDEAFQTEDKYLGRICIARRGRRLAGYASVPAGVDAVALTGSLLNRIPN
jgi:hypothetical protein